jgi:hypothetical protein
MSILARKLMDAPAAGGFSCNLTVGEFSGFFYGYDTGVAVDTFGSISGQPISGEVMDYCFWFSDGSTLSVGFAGDLLSTLDLLDVHINGVNYGGIGDWAYGTGTTLTVGSGPTLTSGTYLLEFK